MNFNTYTQKLGKNYVALMVELGRAKVFQFDTTSDTKGFKIMAHNLDRVGSLAQEFVIRSARMPVLDQLEIAVQTMLWASPKVFRPTLPQLRMLAEMNINIPAEEYVQPFETLAIEIPDGYRTVNNPMFGKKELVRWSEEQRLNHAPAMMLMHRGANLVVTKMMFDSMCGVSGWFRADPSENMTVEDWLVADHANDEDSLVTTEEEWGLELEIRRACLNYCLLLDEIGVVKKITNQEQDLLKKVGKGGLHLDANKKRLLECPKFYDLRHEVVLHRTVGSHEQLGESTGRKNAPHHRRGHYRMQPTREGKKRIRIPPVFVNKHLFLGGEDLTKYVHKE